MSNDFDDVENELRVLSNSFRQSLGSVIQFVHSKMLENNLSVMEILGLESSGGDFLSELDRLCFDDKWVNYKDGQVLSAKEFSSLNEANLSVLVNAMTMIDSDDVKSKLDKCFSFLEEKYNVGIFIPPNGKKEFALLTYHPLLKTLDSYNNIPAIETFDMSLSKVAETYYENGVVSNITGPAVVSYFADGNENVEYWLSGKKVLEQDYFDYVKNISDMVSKFSLSVNENRQVNTEMSVPVQGVSL